MNKEGAGSRVVVVGAGMAGLVAAVRAQQLGAEVMLLEKGEAVGGTMTMSGGGIWCFQTYEGLRRVVPRGDADLCRTLVEDFPGAVEWLEALDAPVAATSAAPHKGFDRWALNMEPGTSHFAAHMRRVFQKRGGVLLLNTSAMTLELGGAGEVTGIVARTLEGVRTIEAGAVILATGGFQGNPELMSRYFGQWADRLILRANPRSTGDGLILGTEIGAATSHSMSSFYGHLLPGPPAQVPTDDFVAYTHYFSDEAVLVNLRGERFVDESQGDEMNAQAVAREPEALAFIIYDDYVYKNHAVRKLGGGRVTDTFYGSKVLGAPAVVAQTIGELAGEMRELGVYEQGVLATLREFNEAAESGQAAHLRIPRQEKANPVVKPPFYALCLTPGVTFTLGGLRIDADARVIDRRGLPIEGLYAAGADGGGVYNEQYGGSLCLGLVFGRRAAQHAAGVAAPESTQRH